MHYPNAMAGRRRQPEGRTEDEAMDEYDEIVVGARAAGSPTAMLLAQLGHRVLLVDRATFPSDTISTHLIHPPGMAALARWGLADRVTALTNPAVTAYRLDLGEIAIVGHPRGLPTAPSAYAPRRTSLDALLVEAAAAAGVEVREGVSVTELAIEDGVVRGIRGRTRDGATVTERARVVVGADGLRSMVATAAGASPYLERPIAESAYYAYWSGLPDEREFQLHGRERTGFGIIPTEDGLSVVLVAWPIAEFDSHRRDITRDYVATLQADPAIADRLQGATQETRVLGENVPNRYRQSFGPGWALVGDAGYVRDAITAQGISDAFLDAEALAPALDDALGGRRPFDEVMAERQQARDARTMPMFEFTLTLAAFGPPDEETLALFGLLAQDQTAADDFASALAGTLPVPDFFERYAGPPA